MDTSNSARRRWLALSVAFFALFAGSMLSAPVPVLGQVEPIRIMPLGDSITEGTQGDATYRYFLWDQLNNAGYSVDFVGSMTGVRTGVPKYPNFDQNHEGHWGWRADRIANGVTNWAKASVPRIVLLHAGTNDIIQGQTTATTITDLRNIIKRMRTANPNTTFLIAKIIPIAGKDAQVQELNQAIPALVNDLNTSKSPVVAVDMFTGFNASTDLRDGVHPTESGYQKMADDWFAALAPFLSTSPPPTTTTTTAPTTTSTSTSTTTTTAPPQANEALFVSGNATSLSEADRAVRNRLTGLGLVVTLADDDLVQASAASGKSVVLVSATVDPAKIGTKFAGTATPMIVWHGGLFDDLGMTGNVSGTDFGTSLSTQEITIVQPSHPLAAGRSGTILALNSGARLTWGRPSAGGVVVAHVPLYPSKPALFAYEAGASMVTGVAPARRVGLFLYVYSASALSADGWAMFDATVNWARG